MLAAAVVQPLTGWIGRQYGEVRTFVSSALLFVLFSALCGLATSMPMLIAGRLVQGLVSGPMMSVGQALLLRNYPVKLRGLALGLWAMVVIIAPIFGPIMGGWITDNLSWPWLFYINVPVGILAALIIGIILRRRESTRMKTPIDAVGLALLVIGVGSLQFMLDNGNEKDWFGSVEIVTAAVIAVVAIGLMIPWELTDRHPVVDLHLFQRRNFLVGCLDIAVAYFAFMGVNIMFPLWLQTTLGYTSTWAGLAMAPVGILALVLAPFIGRNLHRINLRAAATFAFLLFAVNIWWIAGLNDTAAFRQLALPRLFQGIGVPLFFLPLNTIIMSGVGPAELASAAGLSNFIRTLSGSFVDGGERVPLEHAHRLPPRRAHRAHPPRFAGVGVLPARARRPRRRRNRHLRIHGSPDHAAGHDARRQRRILPAGTGVPGADSLRLVRTPAVWRAGNRRRPLSHHQ